MPLSWDQRVGKVLATNPVWTEEVGKEDFESVRLRYVSGASCVCVCVCVCVF